MSDQKLKVLVVEDDNLIAELVTEALNTHGYDAQYCTNSKSAVSEVLTLKYQIVLTDILMPELSGLDLLSLMRDKEIMSRVIIMSGNADLNSVFTALTLGAEDFLLKPFEINEILESVSITAKKIHRWQNITQKVSGSRTIL